MTRTGAKVERRLGPSGSASARTWLALRRPAACRTALEAPHQRQPQATSEPGCELVFFFIYRHPGAKTERTAVKQGNERNLSVCLFLRTPAAAVPKLQKIGGGMEVKETGTGPLP